MSAVIEQEIPEHSVSEASARATERPAKRLRLYFFSKRLFDAVVFRTHRVAEGLHAGVWLGLLDSRHISAAVFRHYEGADLYRTSAHNLHGFLPHEEQMMRDYFLGCRSVLVAAAGGGREVIALARAGVQVEGFECNPGLVEKCNEFLAEAGVSARLLQATPDHVPAGLSKHDGVIVGYGAYPHIVGRSNRVAFLKELKVCLHPRAFLFVSAGRRPEGSHYHAVIYQIARVIRWLRRAPDRIELGDDSLNCFSHRFVQSELRSELEEAGFKVIDSVETHEIYTVAQLQA